MPFFPTIFSQSQPNAACFTLSQAEVKNKSSTLFGPYPCSYCIKFKNVSEKNYKNRIILYFYIIVCHFRLARSLIKCYLQLTLLTLQQVKATCGPLAAG